MKQGKGNSSGNEVLLYPIGAVARLMGVSPAVLRLWEREGLINPRRTRGGHRFYTAEDVARLRRIIHLRRVERLNIAAIRRELGDADTSASDHLDGAVNAGRRLRALRLRLGLSLAEVAARTGLSTSFLSAVERGLARISLGNLFKLADAYGTTVPGLTAIHRHAARRLVHPDERPRFVAAQGQVVIEDLITHPGALEAQRIEIQPGGGSEDAYSHPGEEFIYVLSGQLAFWIDESEYYLLQAGDSLYFPSTCLHRWRNDSDGPTTVLWINVPLVEAPAEGSRANRGRRRLGARPRPGGTS